MLVRMTRLDVITKLRKDPPEYWDAMDRTLVIMGYSNHLLLLTFKTRWQPDSAQNWICLLSWNTWISNLVIHDPFVSNDKSFLSMSENQFHVDKWQPIIMLDEGNGGQVCLSQKRLFLIRPIKIVIFFANLFSLLCVLSFHFQLLSEFGDRLFVTILLVIKGRSLSNLVNLDFSFLECYSAGKVPSATQCGQALNVLGLYCLCFHI